MRPRSQFGPKGVAALVRGFAANRKSRLGTLWLSSTGMGDEGALVLADALGGNSNLEVLDIWNNSIGPTGAPASARRDRARPHRPSAHAW